MEATSSVIIGLNHDTLFHKNTIVGCLVTFEGYSGPCEKDSRTLLRGSIPFKYFAEHV